MIMSLGPHFVCLNTSTPFQKGGSCRIEIYNGEQFGKLLSLKYFRYFEQTTLMTSQHGTLVSNGFTIRTLFCNKRCTCSKYLLQAGWAVNTAVNSKYCLLQRLETLK